MSTLDPALARTLSAIVSALGAIDVPFCIVGALVPELLLAERPLQATNDADAVVFVPDLEAFERVKREVKGFGPTAQPYRLQHKEGGLVDLLPYSEALTPGGRLELPPDYVFNMAGFSRIAEAAVQVSLASGEVIPVAPVPLYVLLKLVAYTDRRLQKDIEGVRHCLRHYAEDDDRRFGLESGNELVPWEFGTAFLTGIDGAHFLDARLRATVVPLLERFLSEGIPVAQSYFADRAEEDAQYFHWYRRGLGV